MPAPPSTAAIASATRRSTAARRPVGAVGHREGGVERDDRPRGPVGQLEGVDARGVEEERVEREQLGGLGRLGEQRLAGAEQRAQAHHQALAQRVDGRVGDLGEALAQVVADRPGARRQVGQRRVVAHRERGLVGVVGHGLEHHGQLLLGEPVHGLAGDEVVGHRGARPRRRRACRSRRRPSGRRARRPRCAPCTRRRRGSPGSGSTNSIWPGPSRPALDRAVAADVDGADLGAARRRSRPRRPGSAGGAGRCGRGGAHADAVGEHDAGRAVPRLHQRRVVAVEAADLGVEVAHVLPRLGHEHGHRRGGGRGPPA